MCYYYNTNIFTIYKHNLYNNLYIINRNMFNLSTFSKEWYFRDCRANRNLELQKARFISLEQWMESISVEKRRPVDSKVITWDCKLKEKRNAMKINIGETVADVSRPSCFVWTAQLPPIPTTLSSLNFSTSIRCYISSTIIISF